MSEAQPLAAHANQLLQTATKGNASFSRLLPGMQFAQDSHSIGAFKKCPRLYLYTIILGYQPRSQSVHLTFGIQLHAGIETYHHQRAQGGSHEEGLQAAVQRVLMGTWNPSLKRPWASEDPNKNRLTLVRTIVDYLDRFEHDSLETIILSDGKPAVELLFAFGSGFTIASTGEQIVLCGRIDRLARLSGDAYAVDPKTTKSTLSPSWFQGFTPFNQFSLYTLAGKVAFKEPLKGVIVDGIQVAVNFNRFERHLVPRSEEQLKEWHRDLGVTVRAMEQAALDQYWPMNDTACFNCDFRRVCSMSPSARQQWLESDFGKRQWDPLRRPEDI